jgi:phage gpG-like protein
MVRIRVTTTGLAELRRDLTAQGERARGPLRPLMSILAQDWASTFQRRILERELDLPTPHPATVAIRRYYGHDGKPRLFRDGTLAHSIGPLDIGDDHFDVGTTLEYAAVTLHGGTVQGPGGPRTVQPHPFLVLDAELLDDTVGMITDYVLLGEGGGLA